MSQARTVQDAARLPELALRADATREVIMQGRLGLPLVFGLAVAHESDMVPSSGWWMTAIPPL
jgi:hypothetical protein